MIQLNLTDPTLHSNQFNDIKHYDKLINNDSIQLNRSYTELKSI